MATEITKKANKRRGVAFGLVGVVGLTAVIAGATSFANLNKTISDGPDSHHVYSEQVDPFGFQYHSATQTFDTDISITNDMSFKRDVKNIVFENTGSIPAQYAFKNVGVPELDADNPIWDEAHVIVNVPVLGGGQDHWSGTLREYLDTAFVTNHILGPGESTAITVQILSPNTYTWQSESGADAVDIRFATQLTFNQLTHPTSSPLWKYASENGEQRGGILDPDMNSNFNSQLDSKMVSLFTLPADELDDITL